MLDHHRIFDTGDDSIKNDKIISIEILRQRLCQFGQRLMLLKIMVTRSIQQIVTGWYKLLREALLAISRQMTFQNNEGCSFYIIE